MAGTDRGGLGLLMCSAIMSACTPAALSAQAIAATAADRREETTRHGLRYVIEGAGPPVVLIHAFQSDLREWDEVAPLLARSHRVIRYDVRGHGRSAGLVAPIAATDDLRQLLDEIGVGKASVVGLSMGSEIALDFALAHPGCVDRVVMV